MEDDDGGLVAARLRLRADGYDLGDARQLEDGTFRIEAWPHGVEFHAAPVTGVGTTVREAIADLIRTLPAPGT